MKRQKFRHAILFGDGTLQDGQFKGLSTYEDFHLIPSSRPTIGMPGVETKFVTIPGRDGTVDLSEFLHSGRPAFGDRSGTFEFVVENDFDPNANPEEFWMTIYPKLLNELHGKRLKIVLQEDDPDYYWEGRLTVDSYEADDGNHSKVSISYAVGPFKWRIRKTSEKMLWDNFNFEKDHDMDPLGLDSVTVSGTTKRITIWGDGAPFQLEVTGISGSPSVTFGGETATVSAGSTVKIGHAAYGNNVIKLTGTGKVSIDWRGGSL